MTLVTPGETQAGELVRWSYHLLKEMTKKKKKKIRQVLADNSKMYNANDI